MADAPKRTAYSVTNTQLGTRGIWSEGACAYLQPGETAIATLSDDEKSTADGMKWFDIAVATDEQKQAAGIADLTEQLDAATAPKTK